MKNAKRILALIAAVLLFGMYLSTLIFALIGSPHSIDLLGICRMYDRAAGIALWLHACVQTHTA